MAMNAPFDWFTSDRVGRLLTSSFLENDVWAE